MGRLREANYMYQGRWNSTLTDAAKLRQAKLIRKSSCGLKKQFAVSVGVLTVMTIISVNFLAPDRALPMYKAYIRQVFQESSRGFQTYYNIHESLENAGKNKSLNVTCYELKTFILTTIKNSHDEENYDLIKTTVASSNFLYGSDQDCFSNISLKLFNVKLYENARRIITRYKCDSTADNTTEYDKNMIIYSPYKEQIVKSDISKNAKRQNAINQNQQKQPVVNNCSYNAVLDKQLDKDSINIALITTMYHDRTKQYIFINTIFNWAHLSYNSHTQPVLFIADIDMVEKSGIVLYLAYLQGWIIAAVPVCLKSGYPLLNTLFQVTRSYIPGAEWYGYANGDIQFTPLLSKTVEDINNLNSKFVEIKNSQISFISSRRYSVNIAKGRLITNYMNIRQLLEDKTGKLQSGIAIDLFIYHRNCTSIFDSMPPFAIARRGYDNWLIYDVLKRKIGAVDITATNPMVHLGVKGLSHKQNSHNARKQDGEYNIRLPIVKKFRNWIRKVESLRKASVFRKIQGNQTDSHSRSFLLGNKSYKIEIIPRK